jgi:16S rRNA (cytosine967-C5)-methyltransferase
MRDDDRALCHELVLGVLRQQLWLDYALAHFANRRIETLDLEVKLALRLGLYQLRFLSRIPPSAAVDESVKLVREARLKSAVSFVNAVLRRATREPDYDPATHAVDPLEKLAIENSHPLWLIERWVNSFGFDETTALARANNKPAPMTFRLTAKTTRENKQQRVIQELEASGALVEPSKLTPDSWRVTGDCKLLRKFAHDGLIYFQDEASQLVAHLLAAQPNERVLDVCAAPGSKTTLLCSMAPKAMIVAGDLHEHRLRTLRDLAIVQGCESIHLLAHDGTRGLPFADASFDRVLVDAPCSGTGTLRHNPEIRWRIKPDDIARLSSMQKQILANAAFKVRVGGLIVYSTCSVERDENEIVIEDFLENHSAFDQVRLNAPAGLPLEDGAIRTWPHRQDVDGFFIAAFRRTV